MLDFIIVSLPRSGSTWLSNLLTTEHSICWHDSTGFALPHEMDNYPTNKRYKGICCTAAWMWKDWYKNHPAKKLVIVRDITLINASMEKLGMPEVGIPDLRSFFVIEGKRVQFSDLFLQDKAREIWEYLLPNLKFDHERYQELVKMNIQPSDRVQVPDSDYIKRAISDLKVRIDQA